MQPAFSTFPDPAEGGRRAQLVLALLLLSILPVFWLSVPAPTHAVRLDLPPLPDTVMPTNPFPPQAYLLTSLMLPNPSVVPRRIHELVLTAGGKVLLDGRQVDITGLFERLRVIAQREGEWVDLRPDPNVRYELFAEILAVTRRTRLERLRLDNGPFRHALDGEPAIRSARVRRARP